MGRQDPEKLRQKAACIYGIEEFLCSISFQGPSCSWARTAVFGIGGVGGYTVEALARSGVGTLDLIDDDRVCLTNVNRQIFATRKTVGQYKVDVAEARIKEINPDAVVHTYKTFYAPQTADQFDFTQYDYVVDAIDTVILGAILGIVLGEKASVLYPIGQIWLNLLFVLLVPLIFFSIASSIANIADARRVGKLLAFTISIFIVTAMIAGIYMFAVTGIFGVDTSIQLDTSEVAAAAVADSVGGQIVNTFTVGDFPQVISRSHILALIVFTVFFGITVSLLGEQGKPVASWLNSMSLVFYKMVALLMKLAPLGLMAYFANLTGTYGPELLFREVTYPTDHFFADYRLAVAGTVTEFLKGQLPQ